LLQGSLWKEPYNDFFYSTYRVEVSRSTHLCMCGCVRVRKEAYIITGLFCGKSPMEVEVSRSYYLVGVCMCGCVGVPKEAYISVGLFCGLFCRKSPIIMSFTRRIGLRCFDSPVRPAHVRLCWCAKRGLYFHQNLLWNSPIQFVLSFSTHLIGRNRALS